MKKKYNINDLAPLYYQENKQNRSFDIHNQRSHVNTFYQINAPFQVTYEFCSGTNDDDYLNIVTLSGDDSIYSREAFSLHSYMFKNRPSHFHDYFEFMIILEGSVVQRLEDKAYLDFIPTYNNRDILKNLHNFSEDMIKTLLFPHFGSTYYIKGVICSLLFYSASPQNYHCTNVELN